MKHVRVVLIGLAVFSLTVAVAWAAEETAWANVKASVAPQPAAKVATEPVVFYMRNGPRFIEPGATRVSKGGQNMATDFLVAWDVDGDLEGTLTIAGGHSHMNTTSRRGQENFYACFDVAYGDLSGTFEGRVADRMLLMESTEGSYTLHGTGDFAGMNLHGRLSLFDIPPNLSFVLEGEILAPHGWPEP